MQGESENEKRFVIYSYTTDGRNCDRFSSVVVFVLFYFKSC